METYIKNFHKFQKFVVYNFGNCSGGIGDCIKFFLLLLEKCVQNNLRLYYKVNNTYLEKYLKLKFPQMYITGDKMKKCVNLQNIFNVNDVKVSDCFYFVKLSLLYKLFTFSLLKIPASDVFTFSSEVLNRGNELLLDNVKEYTSIHLRLGDKHLETDMSHVPCKHDERKFNESTLIEYINENKSKNLVFFCDNNKYKNKLKEENPSLIIANSCIGHTSLSNTTNSQCLDAVTEFYLLTKSEEIVCASNSGFSLAAALFEKKTIVRLY